MLLKTGFLICKLCVLESKKVVYSYTEKTSTPSSVQEDMALWQHNILKLRVKTCGEAIVKFYSDGNVLRAVVIISQKGLHVSVHTTDSLTSTPLFHSEYVYNV